METSQFNCCLKQPLQSSHGLTLIEVLIALAIIGIAMTAVIKATSQNILSTSYLQNKTVAMWVGQQVMNEVRAGLVKLPNPPDKLSQTTIMLDKKWNWTAVQESTPNRNVRQIVVRVFNGPIDDEEAASPIITLESYLYHAEK